MTECLKKRQPQTFVAKLIAFLNESVHPDSFKKGEDNTSYKQLPTS